MASPHRRRSSRLREPGGAAGLLLTGNRNPKRQMPWPCQSEVVVVERPLRLPLLNPPQKLKQLLQSLKAEVVVVEQLWRFLRR